MQSRKRTRLRPAEGWPKDWYYSGELDTVNIEALLAPDEFFNRVILGRTNMAEPFTRFAYDEEIGVSLGDFVTALQTWIEMNGRSVTVEEAAKTFNTTEAIIRDVASGYVCFVLIDNSISSKSMTVA